MSYSMLFAGSIALPADRLDAFLDSDVDASSYDDWAGSLADQGSHRGTVRALLDGLPDVLIPSAGSFLETRLDTGGLWVGGVERARGLLSPARQVASTRPPRTTLEVLHERDLWSAYPPRREKTVAGFLELAEAAKHCPCAKRAWVEFLGQPPSNAGDRVDQPV